MSRGRSTTRGRAPRRPQWGGLEPEWDAVFIPEPPARPTIDAEPAAREREPEGVRFIGPNGRTWRRVVIES